MKTLLKLLFVLAACTALAAQDELAQLPKHQVLASKPRAKRLTHLQKRALARTTQNATFSSTGATVYYLSPRNMVLTNKASASLFQPVLVWPAADAAYMDEPLSGGGSSMNYKFLVPSGTRYVILTVGMRLESPAGKEFHFTWRTSTGSGGSGQQTVKSTGSGYEGLASTVFMPARPGWHEGVFECKTPDTSYVLDYLEFTFVK